MRSSSAVGSPLAGSPLAHARHGLDACVHCGFCLQACPTYVALGDENDSPRGRLVIMRGLVAGTLSPWDEDVHTHIDRCLGCRACETACPSGVPYGELLEATRATLPANPRHSSAARLVLWLFSRDAWLLAALFAARLLRASGIPALLSRLPGQVGFAMAMLAATRSPVRSRAYRPEGTGARGTVAVLRGCVMHGLYRGTNRATERTLIANDYAVVHAPGQQCCGALHAHAGDLDTARALARANVAALEASEADFVAINAAGCGAMIKAYGALLGDEPAFADRAAVIAERARDVTELLAEAGPARGSSLPFAQRVTVTYDPPCHLMHAQRVTSAPLALLAAVPGIDLVPLADADQCCGSAGIYNLTEPELAAAILAPKVACIVETAASLVATGNPGCLMQIGAGLIRAGSRARTVHPVDLLDASYAASSPA